MKVDINDLVESLRINPCNFDEEHGDSFEGSLIDELEEEYEDQMRFETGEIDRKEPQEIIVISDEDLLKRRMLIKSGGMSLLFPTNHATSFRLYDETSGECFLMNYYFTDMVEK